ncbi:MAG: peptidoglycan DD-metalloendopeptidase family protein [Clostridiales bacterium]|nr:peptidoglycan DD-metalloendopeptidase family protein [Clostridiales bacterium]
MPKKLHTLIKDNIGIIVCILAVLTAFLLSLTYDGTDGSTYRLKETSYDVKVYNFSTEEPDESEESEESSSIEELSGFALYINGEYIGTSEDKTTLKKLLDGRAEDLAASRYGEYIDATIEDKITIEYTKTDRISGEDEILQALSEYNLSLMVEVYEQRLAEIPFNTIMVDDSDSYEGTEKTLQKGSGGISEEVYVVTYSGGEKVGETLHTSTVKEPPVNEIIKRGIKLKTNPLPSGLKMFIMPYEGGITSEYGSRYLLGSTFHGGLDIAAKEPGGYCYGEYIMAAGDGVVVSSGYNGDFGILTIIEHPNGIRTYYAHQSETLVKAGDSVKQGDYIGRIGSTGQATGPHVHFEVRLPDGKGGYERANPKSYIIDYESYYRK